MIKNVEGNLCGTYERGMCYVILLLHIVATFTSNQNCLKWNVFFPEVNIMWAAHQAHHSSEDYNLTTALRQSVVQNYSSAVSISS